MELHYQKLIGELVYPMVKCQPAYSFHIIKLSQFMANPAALHYEALKQVTIYIYHTIDDGIYYWWDHPNISLSPGQYQLLHQIHINLKYNPTTSFRCMAMLTLIGNPAMQLAMQ
jgi:hypothetical protein